MKTETDNRVDIVYLIVVPAHEFKLGNKRSDCDIQGVLDGKNGIDQRVIDPGGVEGLLGSGYWRELNWKNQ